MNAFAAQTEATASALGLDPFLPQDEESWQALQASDEELLEKLAQLNRWTLPVYSIGTGLNFNCGELASLVRPEYDTGTLAGIEQFLEERGTLKIPTVEGTVTVDGLERKVLMVAATETGADGASHGEMSSMLYLRDQVQTAGALMELALADPEKYREEGQLGKTLLVSALHLMSTDSQLERFDDVIEHGAMAGQADWPQISLHFDDLDGRLPNGWRNKQDSFQMLAYLALDAIGRGFLDVRELTHAHKEFLAAAMPLLDAVGFPLYESSGSWEEVEARRTSVIAVETALLCKMQELTRQGTELDFLKRPYADSGEDFDQTLQRMAMAGLRELGERLPDESPDYEEDSVKFRGADAALAYVLRYNLPQLLAGHKIPMAVNGGQPMAAEAIEDLVLDRITSLIDRDTGGIARYEDDSYQRVNFHTNTVQATVKAIKQKVSQDAAAKGGEADLDQKQWLRDQLTPGGKPPAWTHTLGQIASWAALRLEAVKATDEAAADRYRKIGATFLNAMLSTVTGDNQWHAVLGQDGRYQVKKVPADKLPECIIAYRLQDGTTLHTASPHTPLNWSTAMLKEAIGLLSKSTA